MPSKKQYGWLKELEHRPLNLRIYPDPVLRQASRSVDIFNPVLEDFIADMLAVMRAHKGIGLAAPQVGILLRIIAADIGQGPVCVVNPRITHGVGNDVMAEGCLSVPGVQVNVRRDTKVEVRGKDARGKEAHLEAEGLLARVLQHEIDHLKGVLICDYGPPIAPEEFEHDLYP
ncbi:MAG: peptide deformylase [Deltaproteobacteria bacterium]|nr:peptide deformylase [Deltaproteobacteria bacterium]